ncbi:1016_t:CDS:2, partial [Racocetra persica]
SNEPKVTLLELQDLTQYNTVYMSGYKNGTVVLFNKEINSNSFRISCGLYSAHIMMTNFENATFGKLKIEKGFLTQKHPFNFTVPYLAIA